MKRALPLLPLLAALPFALVGCETEDPTFAVVDNDFPMLTDGGTTPDSVAVYKVWWSSTLFSTPVAPGAESQSNRVVTGSDVAYALLAPAWDPSSGTAPTSLLPVRTSARLFVARGGTLHIRLSAATVEGICDATPSQPLTQDDADFITQRIFPDEFANGFYDARTCTFRVPVETGQDSGKAP